jgi:hypothetical protein
MSSTPWRFNFVKLQVGAGAEHTESSTVPSVPAAGFGMYWVRDDAPNLPMFTDDAGTDFILTGRSWACATQQTTDATPTNVTVLSSLAAGEQTPACVLIKADNGASNTYFRRQFWTFYNDAGVAFWTIEDNGLERRRGLTTATATLAVSGSDIVVTVTGEAATTIDWTICYLTSNTLAGGVAGGGATAGTYPILTNTTLTTAATLAVGDYQKYDPVGGTFIIDMPGTATVGDLVGIKNVDLTNSGIGITLDGNGGDVEDPGGFAMSATVSVTGDGIALLYQYDGTDWYIV